MRVLLDTSSFLWFIAGSDRLSINAQNIIVDQNNDLFLSTVSLWEIAIKVSIGKLELLQSFDKLIPDQLHKNDIHTLSMELNHLSELIQLPFHHRDPFDRLIIAQSMAEAMPVISSDPAFKMYPIEIIW